MPARCANTLFMRSFGGDPTGHLGPRGVSRAADALITRIYGKPQEKLELTRQVDDFDLSGLSLDELRETNTILSEHPELAKFRRVGASSPFGE